MAKSGHHFPAAAGFKNSSGRVQSVSGYTRAVPKKAVGGMVRNIVGRSGPKMIPQVQPQPKGPVGPRSSPKTPPQQIRQAPIMRVSRPVKGGALAYANGGFVKQGDGTMKTDSIGDQGNAVVLRGKPAYSEADKEYGGKTPLRTGYKKGGTVREGSQSDKDMAFAKAAAAKAVAKHVATPVPKGHKGFNKAPMFGKK